MKYREKIAIWKDRKFLIGSIIFLLLAMVAGWILYVSFGHKLIEAMYEGRSAGFLNGIIDGQAKHPVGFYLKQADELFFNYLIAIMIISLAPIYLILLMNNLRRKGDVIISIFYFLFIPILIHKFFSEIVRGYDKSYYQISEFLFNYQGGFVRRGLLGEVILNLYNYFGINPYSTILLLCASAYLVLIVFFVRSFLKKGYPIFILPFVFFLGNPILNDFWVRKDILMILVFILTIYFSIKKSKTYIIPANLFFIIGLLAHEAIGFFCFPILLLVLINKNNDFFKVKHPSIKSILTSLLELCPSIVTFFCVLYHKGSSAISKAIWDSWESIAFPFQAKDNHQIPEAIEALSWTLKKGLSFSLDTLKNFNDAIYAPIAWSLILLIIYYLLTNADKMNIPILKHKSSENFINKKSISNALIFQFLSITPLFILGWDYSRWVFYWVASSFSIVVLIPDEKLLILFPKWITVISSKVNIFLDAIFSKSKGFIFLLYLFLGVPGCSWGLNMYINTTPVFILLQYFSKAVYQIKIFIWGWV